MSSFASDFGYNAFRSVSNDKADSFNRVMFNDDPAGNIASASFTYVLSGPPLAYMAEQDPSLLTPIGLLVAVNGTAQRPIASLSEFGSNARQNVAGAPSYNATLQRMTSYSGNLLGMLYRWAVNLAATQYAFPPNEHQSGGEQGKGKSLQLVSFSSDILDVPFGIYVCSATESGRMIDATYWENCLLVSRGKTVSAGEGIIMENVQLVYEREYPMTKLVHFGDPEIYVMPSADDGDDREVNLTVNNPTNRGFLGDALDSNLA